VTAAIRWLQSAALGWIEWKQEVKWTVAYQADSLHVISGTLVFMLLALVFRRSFASPLPWVLLLLVSCVNETIDLLYQYDVGESAKDTLLTMAVPSLLLVTIRLFPQLYQPLKTAERPRATDYSE
jgi:hypothetical protein